MFNKTMKREYNLLDVILLDECSNAEEIMEESFRKYSNLHDKIAGIIFIILYIYIIYYSNCNSFW